jgi:hypothetical protein
MKNRYGDEYRFEKVSDNTYTIVGELKHWRFGGREGQESMDLTDLGFVDPSGGPFISVGSVIERRKIIRISANGDLDGSPRILFEVEQ